MICPKCKGEMKVISHAPYPATKCSGCGGIWFRENSFEKARHSHELLQIDDADEHARAVYNDVRDISCPECHRKMTKMVDRSQHHIQLEACSYCSGVFLDSGELQDLNEFSLSERIEQALQVLKSHLK